MSQLEKKDQLTSTLRAQIANAVDLKELEDVYAPFKKVFDLLFFLDSMLLILVVHYRELPKRARPVRRDWGWLRMLS